jgi:hypothetical protein
VHIICPSHFYRTGDGDISFSRDLDYSLPRHHMRHPMVWLTWADAQQSSRLIWKRIRSTVLRLVHQIQLIYFMQVRIVLILCAAILSRNKKCIKSDIAAILINPNCHWIFYHIIMLWLTKDDEKAKDDWIGSVGRAIVRCSSTYVSKGGAQGGKGGNGNNLGTMNEDYDDDSSDYSNSSNNPYFND